jgi:DNA polymerase III delta prime subunit
VVADAHRLNASAANAFLKTLEEPPPRSLIILCAPSTAGLLPTILSRCQKVGFDPYPEAELARVLAELAADRPQEASAAARLADGDARRGVALLEPEARALRQWAETVFDAIQSGRIGEAHLTAERLHQGIIPAPPDAGDDDSASVPAVKDLASKRQRALRFCEFLTLLYGEALACRERGEKWQPRMPWARERIERAAREQPTRTLLAGIARLDVTKHEIDGNLNLGLATAALLQELCDDAQKDRQPARA